MGRKRKQNTEDLAPIDNYYRFDEKSWKADFAFLVEGKPLFVSKAILALESPVFCAMFEGDFAERNKDEIELHEKDYNSFLEFLQCLYPGVRKPISIGNIFTILPLVEEYQVATLKKECENFLLQKLKESDSFIYNNLYCRSLRYSSLYNMPVVEEFCIEYFSTKRIQDIESAERNFPLPIETKNKLLVRMNKKLESKLKEFSVTQVEKESQIVKLQKEETFLKNVISFFKQESDFRVLGFIILDIHNPGELSTVGQSVTRKFRGVSWTLTAKKFVDNGDDADNVRDNTEYLSVWIAVDNGVQCKAFAKIIVKNSMKDFEATMQEKVYCGEQWGYKKLIAWNDFISPIFGRYVSNNKATIHAFLMVHRPVIGPH